ncbi:MAG: hypothetical protein KatS3mg111_3670 [Pirellulaceae bacterium]|nr:MAG: hypothetical protein KatS3mg111_3670 [Pirellulaceae bacterium]
MGLDTSRGVLTRVPTVLFQRFEPAFHSVAEAILVGIIMVVIAFPLEGTRAQEALAAQNGVERGDVPGASDAPLPTVSGGNLASLESSLVQAIAKAELSVVAVSRVRRDREPTDRTRLSPLRSFAMGGESTPLDPDFVPRFYGSGVIVSADGYIVTCAHVVDDPRQYDYYVWHAGQGYTAEVVVTPAKVFAADPFSDLAMLKVDASGLSPIRFGDTTSLKKGQLVIALGNPEAVARDGRPSASLGIVANLGRRAPAESGEDSLVGRESLHEFGTLIQTDARLGIGSSGGALINTDGEMIGLLTSMVAIRGLERPAGFAIAVDELFRRIVDRMKEGKLPEYGFLGIQPEDLRIAERQQGLRGARVVNVIPGLPGQEAGLIPDDIIYRAAEMDIDSRNDLFLALSRAQPGRTIPLHVYRINRQTGLRNTVRLEARLTKKYVATRRPAYALHPPPQWRGLAVEYATALPTDPFRRPIVAKAPLPHVAILSVERGSAAWEAGIRPGAGILSVEGNRIQSPEDFFQQVAPLVGPVRLELLLTDGSQTTVVLPDSVSPPAVDPQVP